MSPVRKQEGGAPPFDFRQLKNIAHVSGLYDKELAALLKITRPTYYLWCRGGKPQTVASYEYALKVLKAVRRALRALELPVDPNLEGDDRAAKIAEVFAKWYVAE